MGDKISAEVRRMAENRYPAFDNTQKFIEIGYNIAYYRKHAGLTQEQLAERVGITMANISILKNGKAKAIKITTLEKICEALECQPGDILEYRKD